MAFQDLTPPQQEFIRKYVISSKPQTFAETEVSIGLHKIDPSREALKNRAAIEKAHANWVKRLKSVESMGVTDQVLNYVWLERDADSYDAGLVKVKNDMPELLLKFSHDKVKEMHKWAKQGLDSAKKAVADKAAQLTDKDWPAEIRKIAQLNGKHLIEGINSLKAKKGILSRELDAVGLPNDLAAIEAQIQALIKVYDDALPKLDDKTKPIDVGEIQKEAAQKLGKDWPDKLNKPSDDDFGPIVQMLWKECQGIMDQFAKVGLQGQAKDLESNFRELVNSTLKDEAPDLPAAVAEAGGGNEKLSHDDCTKIYAHYKNEWNGLKKAYKNREAFCAAVKDACGKVISDNIAGMWRLWEYRKTVVDDRMKALEKEHGLAGEGKGWVAVGSVNLESDYDISVMQHGEQDDKLVEDWVIVKAFNAWFGKTYNTQPGTLFDTNLYASAPPPKTLSDEDTPTGHAMKQMSQSGQDVGALMKQRRFMTWEEYEDYMMTVLDGMKAAEADPADIKSTRTQFEEADGRYQMAQYGILERGFELLKKKLGTDHKDVVAIQKLMDAAKVASVSSGQAMMLQATELLEQQDDVILEINNDLYVEALEEVRQLEDEIRALDAEIAKLPDASDEAGEKRIKMDGLIARAKDLMCDGVFFANEAYHSDGPFKHVVEATQGVESGLKASDPSWDDKSKEDRNRLVSEERDRLRGALSLHECLQSFNEQLGDFVKDLKHYSHEEYPGSGFYRSSKYLDRLFDAAILLKGKAVAASIKFDAKVGSLGEPEALKPKVAGGLLKLRKGGIVIVTDDPAEAEEQMQAYAIQQARSLFGVTTLEELASLFKKYGAKINAQLRKAIADQMNADAAASKAFFTS